MDINKAIEVYRTTINGLIVKENVDEYKAALRIAKSQRYEAWCRDTDTIDIDELEVFIRDIEANKDTTKDAWGRYHNIISKDIFNQGNTFLVRKVNSVFEIVQGNIEEILPGGNGIGHFRLLDDLAIHLQAMAETFSFAVAINSPYFPPAEEDGYVPQGPVSCDIYGDSVFTGYDNGQYTSISYENALKIVSRIQFMLGQGSLDLIS